MISTYIFYTHKVGNKHFGQSPIYKVVIRDGKVALSAEHNGEDGKKRVTEVIEELKNSGTHKRIVVKVRHENTGKIAKIYDWSMEAEVAEVCKAEHEAQEEKRRELKAEIARLKAEIAKIG